MLHFTDPTYMVLDTESEWVGRTRYTTFTDACDAAKIEAEANGREFYVVRIEATASITVDVVDLYGAIWR
jgi:hypothetical protein